MIFRSNSPESGISTSHLSIPDAEFVDADADFDDPLPALGTAKALYTFEGKNIYFYSLNFFLLIFAFDFQRV